MSRLERLVQLLSRWGPAIGTAGIAAVLAWLGLHTAAVAAALSTLVFAAVALIDTTVPRS